MRRRSLAPTTFHNWLGIVTLVLHLTVVGRLLYLESEHRWLDAEESILIILAETSLVLLLIDGLYLSLALGRTTRIMHHLAAATPAMTGLLFAFAVNHSAVFGKGRRLVRYTLGLFVFNSALVFLAYWVSEGAAMGWWLFPKVWTSEWGR